jgi:hypothetical protein
MGMNRITTFDIYPDNLGFRVWDANLDGEETYHEVNEQTLRQGFSSRLGRSVNFSTLGECMRMTIEVWYADSSENICIREDSARAILVPFSVGGWWKIGDFRGHMEVSLSTYSGYYALLFEIKLRDDDAYLHSSQYQANVDIGCSEEWCYLTLYKRDKPIQPEILRLDACASPPYDLASYSSLDPIYPLLMDVESV